MQTIDQKDYFFKAIGAIGKMLAVVASDCKILAAAPGPDAPSPGAATGQRCHLFFFQRATACENCGLASALETGRPVIRRQAGAPVKQGLVLHHCIFPLPPGLDPRAAICAGLDLPDQTALARQAELSRTFLSTLLDNAADGIIAADRNGRIRIYNRTAERIFGYAAAEALAGMDIRRLYPSEGAYEIMARLRDDGHGGKGKLDGYRFTAIDKDGRAVPIQLNASIVYEEGREIATIGFFRDLREKPGLATASAEQHPPEAAFSLGEMIRALTKALGAYDLKFGDAAVQAGFATPEQVARALEKQREIKAKTQVNVPIGRVMIQLGMIDETQRDALLAVGAAKTARGAPPSNGLPATAAGAEAHDPQTPRDDTRNNRLPETEPPERLGFRLEVSPDRLSVLLHREPGADPAPTPETVLARLAEEGIIEGRCDPRELAAYLAAEPAPAQPMTVARGIPPESGSPPEVRYHFDTDPLRVGTVREDGTIDWKDRGALPRVKAGALVCELVPDTTGKPGTDVFGQSIPAPHPPFQAPRCGKGVSLDPDGRRYLADINGMVSLGPDLVLTVSQTLTIDGDIGFKTGHVDFDGHIEVTGAVQNGFRVYGQSLRAESIYGADVHIVGDMIIQDGIFDSRIKCSGLLKAGHIHKATILLEGDLIVAREIIDSKIETNGRCLIAEGAVMASNISAKRGIRVRDVGSQVAKPSTLEIGVDHRLKGDFADARKQITILKKAIKEREAQLAPLRLQAGRIEAEIGVVAQNQDRLATKLNEVDGQLAAPQTDDDLSASTQGLEKMRQNLAVELAAAESAVERLMAQDTQVAEKISAIVQEIYNTQSAIDQLDKELIQIQTSLSTDIGLPVLKATGLVAARTTIISPHASSTIPEDLHRVHIFESKSINETGQLQWALKIMPLR